MSENSIISLQNVNKWFGDFHVLQDVNLEVKRKRKVIRKIKSWFRLIR
jgi:general L-amino acid transport system ATP-binding protein